jgi:hypothetical protein
MNLIFTDHEDIEDLQVPVGGDQLTGIRLQGATA